MRIIDLIHQLLPAGTDAAYLLEPPTKEALNRPGGIRATFPSYTPCPIWPPDLFAVTATIIDRSGCYTEASPDRNNLQSHEKYIEDVLVIAICWESMLAPPQEVQDLWTLLVAEYGKISVSKLCDDSNALLVLLKLFAIADEASVGMGWGSSTSGKALTPFASVVMFNAMGVTSIPFILPYWPTSLCGMVSPDIAIVLPKSITTTKGCTIRSLSHHLALLPCRSTIDPSWALVSTPPDLSTEISLLLIPFPYEISTNSFSLSSPRSSLNNGTSHAAFFKLNQLWLKDNLGHSISGKEIANEFILPQIENLKTIGKATPNGLVLPECALSTEVAKDMVKALAGTGIEFVITGVLEFDDLTNRWSNQAKTFVIVSENKAVSLTQKKHHRWRIDEEQAKQYGLNFDKDIANKQWWEDIEVRHRNLPFYALREDMSMVTLICEDLARMDPAMNAIRAIGPNLVVALLMDGPQLQSRWPGRYAGVLADEPGCAVLTLTCAGMMNLSNSKFSGTPKRVVALWSQANGVKKEIEFPENSKGVLLTLSSNKKHQTTLDNRSDNSLSRELTFKEATPIF